MIRSVLQRLVVLILFVTFVSVKMCQADPDIIFVGAGPVGLYTAIQTKLYNPEAKIHFFEKYPSYQRKHTVQINQNSFKNSHHHTEFKNILKGFKRSARTADLEELFLKFADQQGITIEYKEISSLDQIQELYPKTKIIVGSDGSHSKIRENFVTQVELQSLDLGFLAQVKYEVKGETRELSTWTELLPSLPLVNHTVMENVGRISDNGITPAALSILISASEHAQLNGKATFKNPIIWGSEGSRQKLPKRLQKTISIWLERRKELTNEEIDPASVKVTVTNLPEYYVPQAHFERELGQEVVHYFLVGDAAFGVPYFRSINNGFESGNVLARVLAKLTRPELQFDPVESPLMSTSLSSLPSGVRQISHLPQESIKDYEQFVKSLQTREKLVAHLKSLLTSCLQSSVAMTQRSYAISSAAHEDPTEFESDEADQIGGIGCNLF